MAVMAQHDLTALVGRSYYSAEVQTLLAGLGKLIQDDHRVPDTIHIHARDAGMDLDVERRTGRLTTIALRLGCRTLPHRLRFGMARADVHGILQAPDRVAGATEIWHKAGHTLHVEYDERGGVRRVILGAAAS